MLRDGEAQQNDLAAAWQKLADELTRFSADYMAGRVR
jgi:hypothetical protein